MTIPASVQAAITRLAAYNGNPYNAVSNPYGFDAGGHRTLFPQALQDVADVAVWAEEVADEIGAGQGAALPAEVTIASAATTNLGTAASRRVYVTGTTTITSFGTSANMLRFVRFAAALTLTHNATTLILPGGASITTAAGDTLIAASDGSGNWRVYGYQRASGAEVVPKPMGQCRLSYVSTTQIRLDPYDGNQIFIGDKFYTIPSAGVTLANTGLIASTLYYVYAYINSGALTLIASTAAPAVSATYGHRILSGNPTYTLVGMVFMDTGTPGTFVDSFSAASKRWVLSWFNPKTRGFASGSYSATTSSTSVVELDITKRASFLAWAGETATATCGNYSYNNTATAFTQTFMMFSTTSGGAPSAAGHGSLGASSAAGTAVPISASGIVTFAADGLFYAGLGAAVSTGTGSWVSGFVGEVKP